MEEITIDIDCYQCGTKLQFPFRLFIGHAEYCYCQECQEGVEVYFDQNILHISRLQQE